MNEWSALVIVFSAVLALWPVAFVAGAVWHALAGRWRALGQLAMLLPLWCVAASIGLMQGPRAIALVNEGPAAITRPGLAIAATVFALSFAGLAWALLLRSFRPGRPGPEPADR
jgi:hypothetical protein